MAVIGIDLGGTKVLGAIFSSDGEILITKSYLLENREEKEVGGLIRRLIDELLYESSVALSDVNALGICVPGIADSRTGKVWAPNIKGWNEYPLQEEIENHIENQVKVSIASDRTCYILGESWKGAAKGKKNALFVAVGTGIGLGIIIDGHVVHGFGDIVGAVGWMSVENPYYNTPERSVPIETLASGDGIGQQARNILQERILFPDSILYKKPIETVTSKDIFQAYQQGDSLSSFILQNTIELWGMMAANLVSLFNPEIIIWGGGVFGPASHFLSRIYQESFRWAQPIAIKQVQFETSQLPAGEAGLYGAGYLALLSLNI